MTNFEYYKTRDAAAKAYEKQTGDVIYNIHHGVSAGRFISWLYMDHDKVQPIILKRGDIFCPNNPHAPNVFYVMTCDYSIDTNSVYVVQLSEFLEVEKKMNNNGNGYKTFSELAVECCLIPWKDIAYGDSDNWSISGFNILSGERKLVNKKN